MKKPKQPKKKDIKPNCKTGKVKSSNYREYNIDFNIISNNPIEPKINVCPLTGNFYVIQDVTDWSKVSQTVITTISFKK
jgi:hypothetical protein